MAACSWYSPGPGPCRSAPVTRVSPSVIRARSQRPRCCPASGISSPPGPVRAGPPGLGEQHQRQQPGHLRVGGQAGPQHPGQPDGLAGQVGAGQVRAAAGRVALVEQQVQHVQHGAQPARPLVRRGQPERLVGRLEGGLGPADPLAHGFLWHQEGGGDLPGGQPAHRAQRERDGRAGGQRRVAAQVHQDQRVVLAGDRAGVSEGGWGGGSGPGGGQQLTAPPGVVGPVLVGHPARGHPDQPAHRVVRRPLGGPAQRGRQQRLLDRVLGAGEVPVPPRDHPKDLRRALPEQVLGGGHGVSFSPPGR